ncbi:MAG: hypothetical protein WCD69_12020 [Xanthobacteraceae bacterium]
MSDDIPASAAAADLGVAASPVTPSPVMPAVAPMSYDMAVSRKAEILASGELRDKILQGDLQLSAEWKAITDAISQPPPKPVTPGDELVDWALSAGGQNLPEEVVEELRTNAPVNPLERRLARERLDARKQDPEWVAKYFRSDPEVRQEALLLNMILAAPVKDDAHSK